MTDNYKVFMGINKKPTKEGAILFSHYKYVIRAMNEILNNSIELIKKYLDHKNEILNSYNKLQMELTGLLVYFSQGKEISQERLTFIEQLLKKYPIPPSFNNILMEFPNYYTTMLELAIEQHLYEFTKILKEMEQLHAKFVSIRNADLDNFMYYDRTLNELIIFKQQIIAYLKKL